MTDSNAFFLNAHEAMQRAGIDTAKIYRRIGIDPEELLQPGKRIPHQAQVPFWAAVEAVTGDPEIGLHLCPFVSPFSGEVMNHFFMSSPTMGDGFRRVSRYFRLFSDHLDGRIITDAPGPHAIILAALGDATTPRHTEIMFCYSVIQAFRLATAGKFHVERLELRSTPIASTEEFQRIFACPVGFGGSAIRLYCDRTMLDLPFLHGDPDMASAHEAVVHRHMRRLAHFDTVDAVRKVLASELESGLITPSWVATQLKRTPRGLRTELLDAGTSFSQVLEEVRQSLARKLLARSDETIENIAHLTGFADTNAFFRAFKKWTGSTPMQYRKSKQNPPA